MSRIANYKNGNMTVSLYSDGTKILSFPDKPEPVYPLAIDLCITKYCDLNCPWCHESANASGDDAYLEDIVKILKGLPTGTEIAIGGGDPFSYLDLEHLLLRMADMGLISNITVNSAHIALGIINNVSLYRRMKLIYGLGISWNPKYLNDIESIVDSNTIIHFIAGVHDPKDALMMAEKGYKILILGYKSWGKGLTFKNYAVELNLASWKQYLRDITAVKKSFTAFDTLAVQQLDVKFLVDPDDWVKYYMGSDGELTMYIDAVNMQYAVSSSSTRHNIGDLNIKQMFDNVRNEVGGIAVG